MSLFPVALAVAALVSLETPRGAPALPEAPSSLPTHSAAAPGSAARDGGQFLAGLVGDWIGTVQQQVDGKPPLVRYFRLSVRRQGAQAFETRFRYYRPNPKTGLLEEAGSEQGTSVLEPDGTVSRRLEGAGSVLVDYRPKPESYTATGRAHLTAEGRLEGEASGTIRVGGMPFGLGEHGKIEKAREEWTLRDGALSGRTVIVARFRALFTTRRFKVETICRAQRGTDVAALVAQDGAAQAPSR